jgi:hypothetical protein
MVVHDYNCAHFLYSLLWAPSWISWTRWLTRFTVRCDYRLDGSSCLPVYSFFCITYCGPQSQISWIRRLNRCTVMCAGYYQFMDCSINCFYGTFQYKSSMERDILTLYGLFHSLFLWNFPIQKSRVTFHKIFAWTVQRTVVVGPDPDQLNHTAYSLYPEIWCPYKRLDGSPCLQLYAFLCIPYCGPQAGSAESDDSLALPWDETID